MGPIADLAPLQSPRDLRLALIDTKISRDKTAAEKKRTNLEDRAGHFIFFWPREFFLRSRRKCTPLGQQIQNAFVRREKGGKEGGGAAFSNLHDKGQSVDPTE